jgi:hypothetical protein
METLLHQGSTAVYQTGSSARHNWAYPVCVRTANLSPHPWTRQIRGGVCIHDQNFNLERSAELHAYVYALTCLGVFNDACSLIQDRISTTRLASYKIHMFYMIDLEDSVPANIFTVSRKYVLCFQFTFTQWFDRMRVFWESQTMFYSDG